MLPLNKVSIQILQSNKKPYLNKIGLFCAFIFLIFLVKFSKAQEQYFPKGETVTYNIHYNWGLIWVTAGWVQFTVNDTLINNKTYYHFTGKGATYPKYSWIYRVDDFYQSVADKKNLKPLYFERNVQEGSTRIHNKYRFDYENKVIFGERNYQKKPSIFDTIPLNREIFDVMTLIYASRRIDFSTVKINDLIPLEFLLDGEVHQSYIRFLGREEKEVEGLGLIKCIKFKPLLIEGTIFSGGEDMTVWASDDDQKIPVYVETPILVGSIKAILFKTKGLRNALPYSYLD